MRPTSRRSQADFPPMQCPACARPVAMARANCVYCGAPLSDEVLQAAALAAERVLQSKSLTHLEAAAQGLARSQPPRRYLIVDTTSGSAEVLARACSVSVWEARQWQAAASYRLLKVSTDPEDGPAESGFKASGLAFFAVPEEALAPSRDPMVVESIDLSVTPLRCTLRDDPEAPATQREVPEKEVALIISGSIKRERVKDQAPLRARAPETRLEDAFLVHLHLRNEGRPWEIDPRRTGYEGASLASAHMNTVALVRRLAAEAPHDEAFRYVVPALSPGADPPTEFAGLKKPGKDAGKRPKVIVLDNVAQFRDYSAWRGAVERERRDRLRR